MKLLKKILTGLLSIIIAYLTTGIIYIIALFLIVLPLMALFAYLHLDTNIAFILGLLIVFSGILIFEFQKFYRHKFFPIFIGASLGTLLFVLSEMKYGFTLFITILMRLFGINPFID